MRKVPGTFLLTFPQKIPPHNIKRPKSQNKKYRETSSPWPIKNKIK